MTAIGRRTGTYSGCCPRRLGRLDRALWPRRSSGRRAGRRWPARTRLPPRIHSLRLVCPSSFLRICRYRAVDAASCRTGPVDGRCRWCAGWIESRLGVAVLWRSSFDEQPSPRGAINYFLFIVLIIYFRVKAKASPNRL